MITEHGIVVSLNAGFYDVATANGVVRTRARGVFRKRQQKPMVGDIVTIQIDGSTNYLIEIEQRKNVIGRPAVANVDHVLLVISAVEPDFSLTLLDRFLTFFAWKNVPVSIYLSKKDLVSAEKLQEIERILQYYENIGYNIFKNQEQIKAKLDIAKNNIWTLAGQTGAGKSTLLNTIKEDANQATGKISMSLNRGKHTTRTVTLFKYGQGFLADTPGFSAIDLSPIKIKELRNYFIEMKEASAYCKFRECQHLKEPKCEVKKRVAAGEILESRYANYLLQRQEIEDNRMPEYLK